MTQGVALKLTPTVIEWMTMLSAQQPGITMEEFIRQLNAGQLTVPAEVTG